ncbi:hypothetical protein LSH36_389g02036, partial [Paralvinella palmiformis]
KGDNVKKFREESGAKINISDASCPERIVTVTGTTDQIFKAFTMICKKFEEVCDYCVLIEYWDHRFCDDDNDDDDGDGDECIDAMLNDK